MGGNTYDYDLGLHGTIHIWIFGVPVPLNYIQWRKVGKSDRLLMLVPLIGPFARSFDLGLVPKQRATRG